ncbi:hypothetical protein GCM10027612_63400 [Microbispora bryophytorum subsp. camponoti]
MLPAVAAAGAVAMTLTWTLADHAQSGTQIWLAVPATSLHLLAMALWLGGLVALAVCVLAPAAKRGPALLSLEPALPRFSRLALLCFAVIAGTGLYLSWRQVGTWGALGGTDFGRLLLGKLAVVLGVLALASGARRFVQRRDRARRAAAAPAAPAAPGTPAPRCAGCAARSPVRSCSGSSSCPSPPSWSGRPRPAPATRRRWTPRSRSPPPRPRPARTADCAAGRSR